jgi:uncharacterized protein YndB with AHSA1/START domain
MTIDAETSITDRIERSTLIEAPVERVWQALTDAESFGQWFGADLRGQKFVAGQRTRGLLTMEKLEHIMLDVRVDRIEPRTLFSFYWHPYPVDPGIDYESETPTLVCFRLESLAGGRTRLTVSESGFDSVPADRRLEAFRMNTKGWAFQIDKLVRYAEGQGA